MTRLSQLWDIVGNRPLDNVNEEKEDNDKDDVNNNDKGISAWGPDRDLEFSQGHPRAISLRFAQTPTDLHKQLRKLI